MKAYFLKERALCNISEFLLSYFRIQKHYIYVLKQ